MVRRLPREDVPHRHFSAGETPMRSIVASTIGLFALVFASLQALLLRVLFGQPQRLRLQQTPGQRERLGRQQRRLERRKQRRQRRLERRKQRRPRGRRRRRDGLAGATAGHAPEAVTFNTIYAHSDMTLYSVDPMSNQVTVTVVGPLHGHERLVDRQRRHGPRGQLGWRRLRQLGVQGVPGDAPCGRCGGDGDAHARGDHPGDGEVLCPGVRPRRRARPEQRDPRRRRQHGEPLVDRHVGRRCLGYFPRHLGADPSVSGNTFELSGDIVFYLDSKSNPTGLATIRSCPPGGSGSTKCKSKDYLAGVNMTNLKSAYIERHAGRGVPARGHLRLHLAHGARRRNGLRGRLRPRRLELDGVRFHPGYHDGSACAPTLITIDTTSR